MNDRPPSAAASIYPNLPSDKPARRARFAPSQREQPRLAEALYPSLVPPKPKSAEEKYYERLKGRR
jgi:hypothetical protein